MIKYRCGCITESCCGPAHIRDRCMVTDNDVWFCQAEGTEMVHKTHNTGESIYGSNVEEGEPFYLCEDCSKGNHGANYTLDLEKYANQR